MLAGPLAVFVIGLRHGADPDHIAAIDNLTRNTAKERPILSRFVGTLFALGHSVMVLSIAALAGYLGTRISVHHDLIELIGTWISIAVLVLIAVLNIMQLRGDGDGPMAGLKTRLLPKMIRESKHPLAAVIVGLLFGFGFETSSQVAAYTMAFGSSSGLAGAIVIGAVFCLGMLSTDTLDSVLVHRLVSTHASARRGVTRVWILSVTIVALAVAGYELAQVLGWQSPVPDIDVSGAIVAALVIVFAYVLLRTRRDRSLGTEPTPGITP